MKKAYLLAFQRATNYGALLQIYALKTMLERYGLNVVVIDYVPEWMKVTLKNQPSIFSYFKRMIMNYTFIPFFAKLGLNSSTKISRNDLSKISDGDYYFVGSDQVWNKKIIRNDPTYFLDFAPNHAKKIGYAISMGNVDIEEPFKSIVFSYIKKFYRLSARENFVKNFVNSELPDLNVPVVLDPTLLLNEDDYESVVERKKFKGEFIAVYSAMHDKRFYELAFFLKHLTGLPIVNLGHYFRGADNHEFLKGPGNWLNRIKQSKFFITNSFHGTVFSILFKKNFFVVPNISNPEKNYRFVELLESISLKNRVVFSKKDLENLINIPIDYGISLKKLEERREKSIRFIEDAVKFVD